MTANSERFRTRLSVTIDPELQQRVRAAAAKNEVSLHDEVNAVPQRALIAEENVEPVNEAASWAQLSGQAFARDWSSEEDRVYDSLL